MAPKQKQLIANRREGSINKFTAQHEVKNKENFLRKQQSFICWRMYCIIMLEDI
jgi:hypothetical protein